MARTTRTQTARSERRAAMVTRVLSITTAVVSLAVSAAVASGLTDQLQNSRVNVVPGDRSARKVLCAEHPRSNALSHGRLENVSSRGHRKGETGGRRAPKVTRTRH